MQRYLLYRFGLLGSLLLAWMLLLPVSTPATPANKTLDANRETAAPVVLLELFTSQGCSSCPPADKVLQRLNAAAQ